MIYNPKTRIAAFIFVENDLYLAPTHTECIIELLISKKIIKNEKQFYKILHSENKKNKLLIEDWMQEIENNSIFGELSYYDRVLTAIAFDNLTTEGFNSLISILYPKYGQIPIYYAKYNIALESHFELIKIG